MLDILLATIGSAGDVHPMMALGTALQKRGHRATVVTNEFFATTVRDAGLEFMALGTAQEAQEAIEDPRLWHPTKSFACIVERAMVPNMARLYEMLRERRGPSTVVAASSLCFGARIAQEKLGIPVASIHLQPSILRSLEDGGRQGRIAMHAGVPRLVKQSLMWLVDTFWIDRLLAPKINEYRRTLGLAPVHGIFRDYLHSPALVIGLFPDWFAPVQPDWPAHLHLAGFVLYDRSDQQPVSAEVEDFLRSGPPPLVFTPGSAAATLKDFFRESAEACRNGGYRAMFITNFPQQLPAELPPGIRTFPYLPFSQVLPRCAALVYPGGIGTMAQAIKAGIPQLVVPHGHDQPDNALRMERLGLGRSIYPERYRARRVTQVLRELLNSRAVHERCAAYAPRIDSAASLKCACDLIEQLGESAATAHAQGMTR